MHTIVFRVDSGNIIGTGHIQRCLNLADQFDNAKIYFISKNFDGNIIKNIKYQVFEINYSKSIYLNDTNTWLGDDQIDDARKTLHILKNIGKIDLLIVDHYGINYEWEKYIYLYVSNLCIVDDLERRHYCCILLNPNRTEKYLNINKNCSQLLGNEYAIINKDIFNIEPKYITKLSKINISLGGSDYTNETLKILEYIYDKNIIYDVIVGNAYIHTDKLYTFCQDKKNINIFINMPNIDFLKLLNECDLSIGGSGMTTYERCLLNKPILYLQIADNQEIIVNNLQKYNIGCYLGKIQDDYKKNIQEQIKKCYDNNHLLNLSRNCYKFADMRNIFKLKNTLLRYMNDEIEICEKNIPYGKQTIDEDDIQAVVNVLKENNYLTTGPRVAEFEDKISQKSNMKYGVACNNGTSALHLACYAINIQKDDEVIVPAISFVASSNCVLYCGGKPVFCDIDENTMCIDATKIEALITDKTKAIIAVDFAGQLCDYENIVRIAKKHNLYIIEDAAHAIGQDKYYGDIVTFSFHPVKHITTCEGGMCITNNEEFAKKMRLFRTHGISRDYKDREKNCDHYYEMIDLGYNYRIPDLLCALGISQLKKLDTWILRRKEIAKMYDEHFSEICLKNMNNNVYHLYIIKLDETLDRDVVFKKLKKYNIGVNVHYMPIYLHQYYKSLGYEQGLCPIAEKIYKQIITLPIHQNLTNEEIDYVVKCVKKCI